MDSIMKRTTLLSLICGLSLAALAASPPPATSGRKPAGPRPAPDGSRFLFILDTSASMKSISEAERQALFDLLFSGMDGYMRTGDTIGVWTFSDEVSAGKFPMQIWDSDHPVEVASRATKFLRGQEFAGNNQVEELMSKLTSVIRAVTNLNIIILSDGDTKMLGTPVDADINAAYATRGKERKAAKKPFVTSLIVQDGRIARGAVTLPGESIQLPQRAAAKLAVKAVPAATNTPSPRATVAPIPPKPRADAVPAGATTSETNAQAAADLKSPPVDASSPNFTPANDAIAAQPVETPSTAAVIEGLATFPVETRGRSGETVAPTPSAPARKVLTIITHSNSVPAKVEPEIAAASSPTNSTEIVALAKTNSTAAVVSSSPPPPAQAPTTIASPSVGEPTTPSATIESKPSVYAITPSSMVVAARESVGASASTSQSPENTVAMMHVPAQPALGAIPTLVIGGILLAMSLFLLGIALRRIKPTTQGSFITQSMHRR
jgi:hypothetical protein